MAGIDFRSLFTEQPQRQPSGGPGAESQWRIKPTSFAEDDQDPRFPAFQDAWKRGAGLQDLFGPDTFGLHGTVAPSGGENHRPDVAKVQTLLGEAGYVGIRDGGPNGYPSDMLDSAIRQFQQDKGLKVDGVLKPGGPTITALGGLLGGSQQPAQKPKDTSASNIQGEWDWMDKDRRAPDWRTPPYVPEPKPAPQPEGGARQDDLDLLLKILNGSKTPDPAPQPPLGEPWPEPDTDPFPQPPTTVPQSRLPGEDPRASGPAIPISPKTQKPDAWVNWLRENSRNKTSGQNPADPYPNHTVSEDGAFEHDKYAQGLVRDSDPNETARYLKNVITWNGDVGRGDVADLLGRFAKIDGTKAKTLQDALHQASGERIPFRVAPLGQNAGGAMADLAEGNRTPTAPANPFGPSEGADRWEAGNMAKALLGRSDYKDAITHFQGEVAKNRAGAMPYLAAVHEEMAGKNPELAGKFAMQMKEAGLTMKNEAADAAGEDTIAGGSGDDTLTGNNGNDTVTGDDSQTGPETPPTGDQAPTQSGQNPSDQPEDEQVAGIPEPRKPTDAEVLKDKADILTGTVKPEEGKEEGRPGLPVPPPDRTPTEISKESAKLMGLDPNLVKNDQDAVVMQGVANFRFLDKEAQNKVMKDIGKLDNEEFQGQLRAKVGDLQLQPQWNARSMTDKELGDAVLRNDWNAQALKALSVAPGPGSEAFGWYAQKFEQSAERMRIELTRRGLNKETH